MMIKQLENQSEHTENSFVISYLDKNEAIFLLGLLKPVSCTHCPDFYKGCRGGSTFQESAMLSDSEYIDRHVMGTEGFICGKLRNIIALSKAEEQELSNKFESDFNSRISLLTKKGDGDDKFVLIHDKDEFNTILKTMEKQMVEKIQRDVERINQHNASVVKDMQEKISHQTNIIEQMQYTIQKLKKKSAKNV